MFWHGFVGNYNCGKGTRISAVGSSCFDYLATYSYVTDVTIMTLCYCLIDV